ncbi:MAG: hypothetical protein A4E53_03743 [Pelotomaculum sp. PtaB.Bin104]|nr:MAG: hypothetical protein A4E53_03743 [Pelotomaculum sp. PtaB.Bin104]
MLIHGEADLDVPVENSEILCEKYPPAQLLRVAGAAHVQSFATIGESCLQELTEFLSDI